MSNLEQIEFWNGSAADRWLQSQEQMDRALGPFGLAALDRLAPVAGESILDVGCGAGATLLQIAERLHGSGRVVGVDPSRPLLQRARQRVAGLVTADSGLTVELVEGDASAQLFSERFHGLFSRFGVMFFADPQQAFTALRSALAPDGRLGFVCWQALQENPWCYLPLVVAHACIGDAPMPVDPNAPGPFSFANPSRVSEILRGAGYHRIEIEAFRVPVVLSTEGLDAAVELTFQLGPVARLLAEQPDPMRTLARQRIAEKLAPLVHDDRLELEGAGWLVTARA